MSAAARSGQTFLANVLWSWIGVVASFATATVLAPYMFRRLGDEAYGIWTLTFSIIEYFGLLDFGFKSAIIKNAGYFRAKNDLNGLNVVLNSALAYFAAVAVLLCGITLALWIGAAERFQISPAYVPDFRSLLLIFGFSWGIGLCFTTFSASLEVFQRFDLSSRITIFNTLLRASSIALLLSLGYGLRGAATAAVICQWTFYLLSLAAFLRICPEFRLSTKLVSHQMLATLGRFGWDTVPSTVGWLLLVQGPILLIGHLRPTAYVGYYIVAHRLVQTSLELVWRVGSITNAKTAELASDNNYGEIAKLAERTNRFCFAFYAPISLGAMIYGDRLLATWYSQRLANESGYVLCLLAVSSWFSDAGQFNSSSVLFGMGRQRTYSRLLLLEAVIAITGISFAIGPFGLTGVASVAAGCTLINRGMILPLLACRTLGIRVVPFWVAIHGRTVLAAAAAAAFGLVLRGSVMPGRSLPEVVLASGIMTAFYIVLLIGWALPSNERSMILAKVRERLVVRPKLP